MCEGQLVMKMKRLLSIVYTQSTLLLICTLKKTTWTGLKVNAILLEMARLLKCISRLYWDWDIDRPRSFHGSW
jgi:hypothetical protein